MAPDTDSPKSDPRDGGLRWSGRISLTPRILAVNVFALALLAGGFFYLDSYRTRIVDARLEQSARELKLLAIGLEIAPASQQNALIAAYARQTRDRVRRYAPDGRLIACACPRKKAGGAMPRGSSTRRWTASSSPIAHPISKSPPSIVRMPGRRYYSPAKPASRRQRTVMRPIAPS